MCSDPGQQSIQDDIRNENLNRVVVASCSPFLHETTFRHAVSRANLNPYLYEHVNIREQGSWAHKHDPAGATDKAIRLIAAAVGKLSRSRALEPIRLPNHRRVLIIGGGIAGMKAAADLAGRGIDVLLVEKADRLGGRCNELGRVFETEQPAAGLVETLVRRLNENRRVKILLRAEVTDVTGFIGNFKVTVEGQFGPAGQTDTVQVDAGVIVVATGFEPYAPREGEYGFGQHSAVVTMPEFIRLMESAPAGKRLLYGGKEIRGVAFIHCVGSRQIDGVQEPQPDGRVNEYCSRVCCTTAIRQMLRLRERFPGTRVFDLHQDIRTYGRGHEDYYYKACQAGVTFFRWQGEQPPSVAVEQAASRKASPLKVTVTDQLTWGEELTIPVDMVVLAVGMMPGKINKLLDIMKLPVGDDRFCLEVHPKLRPVESAVNGVLLAGTAQGPKNINESLHAGAAAAAKASIMLATEQVELNPFVATVDPAAM